MMDLRAKGIRWVIGAGLAITAAAAAAGEQPSRMSSEQSKFVRSVLERDMTNGAEPDKLLARKPGEPNLPIASKSDLANYLKLVPISESPLSYLSRGARNRFLDGLVFTSHGVGSYFSRELDMELTASQIYEVLSLFGLQGDTPHFKGARVVNDVDNAIMSLGHLRPPPDNNMYCQGNGGGMYWCVPIDGNSCSDACR